MKDILRQMNSVNGIVGVAIHSISGEVLARALSGNLGEAALTQVGTMAQRCIHDNQSAAGPELQEYEYAGLRIFCRACSQVVVSALCAHDVNVNLLHIALNLAAKKLDQVAVPPPVPPPPPPPAKPAVPSPLADVRPRADGSLTLVVGNMSNADASASFDSLGMIALNRATAARLRELYQADFQKLALFNRRSDRRGVFPVIVINDTSSLLDGAVIIGPGVEKKLLARSADVVEVQIG